MRRNKPFLLYELTLIAAKTLMASKQADPGGRTAAEAVPDPSEKGDVPRLRQHSFSSIDCSPDVTVLNGITTRLRIETLMNIASLNGFSFPLPGVVQESEK
jgi:hypothetical protein